uniref:Protein FAM13A n=1 Tax=Aceria tosichella TaxID=561515 RepID=A0A6G1S7N9_9ACAR
MFKVYSLKDYSQVAAPTENVASSTAGGRLLKSMSQDRKVDSRTKRMSECILSSQTTIDPKSTINPARQQRLPSMIGKMSTANIGTMGPATSVNSLLPQNKNPTLISESRIDRMRKLFVSPLSLRGSTGGTKSSHTHQASNHSRLSLQAGANMLNKPHHLMHAMYRTRVGAGTGHYTRRSPMRQKPGSVRGFRVYGCPLSMANTMYPITCFGRPDIYKQQSVPYILARLCYYIEENSSQLTHEGIFRVSGNARLMEKLKTLFDHLGDAPLESESVDVATSASMLKMYLRELPDPLIPTRMNYYFFTLAKKYSSILSKSSFDGFRAPDNTVTGTSTMVNEASSISDGQSTLDRQKIAFIRDLTKLIRKLPIENYNLLKYLACFLHRISLKQQSNKMSAEALGIVFGPNVFRIRSESYKGLKEQELSNQIMASIITNYKQIFDCELTDALGNLVKSDEFLHLGRERDTMETRERTHQQINLEDIEREATPSRASKKENANSPPIPTTSDAYGFVPRARCPKHGHHVGYHYSDDGDDSDDNEDDDDANINDEDEGDFNDEECDDGSYSRTSDSGSYCSSMASESVESIYEGDVEGEQYDDEEEDEFGMGSQSSSECGSETSYTPSSSHSDTNANEVELSSSNFSSNHSLAGVKVDDIEANIAPPQKPCLVCKRRESAQIEAHKMREQLRLANVNCPDDNEPKESSDTKKQEPVSLKLTVSAAPEVKVEQDQLASAKNTTRMSTRRKRVSDESKKAGITKSDITLDTKDAAISNQAVRPSRHSNHHQSKPAQRHGPLRRRSSSASSLFRVSNRLEHAARKRSVGREDHHAHRAKIHPDRRRCNDPRGYNRKSRNKGYLARKDGSRLYNNRGQQAMATTNKPRPSSKSYSEWKKGDCYVPELLAMNLPPETREELVWNYVSSSFLDVPECDRFYQLRSYNSDETLLRSQEYATTSSVEAVSRARRRFSGQDYLNANQESLLANISSQFQEISETYEDETSNDKADNDEDLINKSRRLDLSGVASEVQTSVVSLLDDQMVSFKHSTLSLNDETSDPIVGQLEVVKDLVKTLERLVRDAYSKGLDQEISTHLFQLAQGLESDEHLDSIAACCFDHLAAKNIIMMLNSLERDGVDWPKIDIVTQNRLIDILKIKISDLKKRYGNLKYIREHYYKHHFKQRQQSESTIKAVIEEQSVGGENSGSPIAGQSGGSDEISPLSSLVNTAGPGQDGKGSNSNKQSTDASLLVDSCKFGSLCPVEFVFNIEKQLASRRRSGSRLVRLNDMTSAQLQSEKLELQKNLLRYEHWFGRPTTRNEFNLIGHLYERYRAVKIIKQQKQLSG